MKKLFIVLAVASLGFVACNNEGEKNETPDTTSTETAPPAAPVDTTTAPVDTTGAAATDTTAKQ